MTVTEFWQSVTARVLPDGATERWGQAMFNVLAVAGVEGIEDCRSSLWDPFYRIKNAVTARSWVAEHLVVVDEQIIGVVKSNW